MSACPRQFHAFALWRRVGDLRRTPRSLIMFATRDRSVLSSLVLGKLHGACRNVAERSREIGRETTRALVKQRQRAGPKLRYRAGAPAAHKSARSHRRLFPPQRLRCLP